MNKKQVAKIITVLSVLGVLLAMGARSGKIALGWPLFSFKTIEDTDAAPQDLIYTMLDAANAGDSETFVSCFSGEIERKLRQTQIEMTPRRFSHYLASTHQTIKGVAIEGPVLVHDREVKIQLEYVYQDRTEVQQISLCKETGGWRITSLDSSRPGDTLVSYGTSVR